MEIMEKPVRPSSPKRKIEHTYCPSLDKFSESLSNICEWVEEKGFDKKDITVGWEENNDNFLTELVIYHTWKEPEEEYKKRAASYDADLAEYKRKKEEYDKWYSENKKEIDKELKRIREEERKQKEIEALEERLAILKGEK